MDTFAQLRELLMPTLGEDFWPSIQLTDDPCIVVAKYPDGATATLMFKGKWRFCEQSEIAGYSHACGYRD